MKSSYCNFGDCVEVSATALLVYVWNSAKTSVVVSFTHEEWATFLLGVKAGEFDVPDEAT